MKTLPGLILHIFVVLVALAINAPDVDAQSPPSWPTPVVTPTPTPSPAPVEPTPDPSPSPTETATTAIPPVPVEVIPEEAPVPEEDDGSTEPEGTESAAEKTTDDTPKSQQVTNPGDVAFTDYRPFDLDEIEYEPAKTKWGNFVNGLRGITRYTLFNGKLRFRLGAKVQLDGTVGKGNDKYEQFYPPIDNDFSVRRLETFAVGRLNKFNFNVSFELGPDWGLNDAWIEGSEGGLEVWGKYLGKLRVGFMNEPFSLERQTSAYHTGFLERSLPVQTFAPGSNIGAMVHDSGAKGRFSWAIGLFSFGQTNESNASNSALSLTGRATYRPVYRNEGRELLHVGVSFSSRSPLSGDSRYRSRPEARFVDFLVDTGAMSTSHLTLLGLEFATIRGPLWASAEYIRNEVSAQAFNDPVFGGSYVKVGWFLTGDIKLYRMNSGTFDRERPTAKYRGGNPFKKKNGGAWEVVGRLSRVDLTDGLVEGGELNDFSAALNWYPNATTRVELNYIYASPKNQGAANIFLLRLQYQPW